MMIKLIELRHQVHMMSPDVANWVKSADFESALRRIENDDDSMAFLMIEALKGIALDPLRGDSTGAFCECYEETMVFNIHFDRWINFIGIIELPLGDRASQLRDAIRLNLDSRMFKAAKMSRRLDRKLNRLMGQADDRARAAFEAIYRRPGVIHTPELLEEACNTRERIRNRRREELLQRKHRVAQHACPGFLGGYSDAVANFLYRHMPCLQ